MGGPAIAVLDYGIGNLRSAEKALVHLGARAFLTGDAARADRADAIVLPGVGAFGACVDALSASGLDAVVRRAVGDGRPFLGICVGMQMLFEGSDEDPDRPGLGVLRGRVTRLPGGVRLPQMGWNTLDLRPESRLLRGLPDPAWVYFVHSYAVDRIEEEIVAARCQYGRSFAAAVEAGPVWATQFHPEKSGTTGLSVLRNFVEQVAR